MLGTLNGALEVRGIDLDPDSIHAEVEGLHEIRDRLPVLTEIIVHYTLRIPKGAAETVQRALDRHQSKCPTAATLSGAVEVRWDADIQISDGE
jgi:uncharacterized OsmC-like protein